MSRNKGFTLIELLVVISIIGLLSSVVLASLNSARVKTRDVKRVADLRQVVNALELYNSDNGHYPMVGNYACFDCVGYLNTPVTTPDAATISAALLPYLKGPIGDPKNLGGETGYLYISDGTEYKVFAWRTPENMKNFSPNVIDYSRCGTVDASGQCTAFNTIGYWTPGGANY